MNAAPKIGLAILVGFALMPLILTAQRGSAGVPPPGPDLNMSEAQRVAIIKADHKKNVADAAALLKLAEKLKSDLDNEVPQVNSVADMKMTDEIQQLAKNIGGRLRHN